MKFIHASLSYTYNGRKRKKAYKPVKVSKPVVFEPLVLPKRTYENNSKYPSRDDGGIAAVKDTSFKQEISAKYTIAPAYNKGAYQVISRENVKDIGR